MTKDYRGATVEDLDRPPALSITPDMLLQDALEMSFEHSFSFLPVLNTHRRLLGYLTAEQLERDGAAKGNDQVAKHYFRFTGKASYEPITPNTPLEELEKFFAKGNAFAVITDDDRRFVLAVATPEDLEKYVKARPELS